MNKIKNTALSVDGVSDCKDVALINLDSYLHITLTIKIPSYSLKRNLTDIQGIDSIKNNKNKVSISEAHDIATEVQNRIIANTGASRVIVHIEPE